MIEFQSSESSPLILKLISIFSMLGGAVVLPFLSRIQVHLSLCVVSAGIAYGVLPLVHQPSDVLWFLGGLLIVMNTVRFKGSKERFLSLWIVGGIVFLSQLRFVAARYWLPFFLPVLLMLIQGKKFRSQLVMLCATSILSIFLMIDDYRFAQAHRDAAQRVQKHPKGYFAGHWGWQHYLQEAHWKPVEDDMTLPKNSMFATINTAWPQRVQGCTELLEEFASPSFWGPRIHTYEGKANFHSSHVHGLGMVFSPWSFGGDPYVQVQLFRACP